MGKSRDGCTCERNSGGYLAQLAYRANLREAEREVDREALRWRLSVFRVTKLADQPKVSPEDCYIDML